MFFRRTALAAGVVVLASALLVSTAGAVRDRTRPTTPTNLRITGGTDTSVSLAWDRATDNSSNFWYCVQRNFGGCIRVDPPRTTMTWPGLAPNTTRDRKSTRLNSSHVKISYAVFCLKKKKKNTNIQLFIINKKKTHQI